VPGGGLLEFLVVAGHDRADQVDDLHGEVVGSAGGLGGGGCGHGKQGTHIT
jgi:hypothetical protein